MCIIQNINPGRSIIKRTFKSGKVNEIIGFSVLHKSRMNLEARPGFFTHIVPCFPDMVSVVLTLCYNVSNQRDNLVIKFRLFNHHLNGCPGCISPGILTFRNRDRLCQLASGGEVTVPIVGNHFSVIGQVAPPPSTETVNRIKTCPRCFSGCSCKAGEFVVPEIDFHTIDFIIGEANKSLQICNLLFQLLNIPDCGNRSGVHFQRYVFSVPHGGNDSDISPGDCNAVVRRHISVSRGFFCHGIENFTIVRIKGI